MVTATVLVTASGLPVLLSPLRSVRDITQLPAVQDALQRAPATDEPDRAGATTEANPGT
jgi:hypothetical protein